MYQLTEFGVLRLADEARIPPDPANSDYAGYLAWLAKGNEPMPIDPPTPEQLRSSTSAAARAYLASTDWYVVRMQETGQAAPDEVLKLRAEARASVIDSAPQ